MWPAGPRAHVGHCRTPHVGTGRLAHSTHHEVSDGPVEEGAIVVLLLTKLDEVLTGFWRLQKRQGAPLRHMAAREGYRGPPGPLGSGRRPRQ